MKFMSRRVVLYFFYLICVNHISYPRVESTEVKLTENSDNELSSNVMKALIMLEIASLSLRSAYIRADSSLWSFVNLRSSVTNEAKVYSIQILPIATTLIRHLQEFSETYDAISFDEFKEDVHVLAKKAEENYKLSKYVSELHKAVYAEFKKLEDQANIVLNDLQMETRRYEAELRPPPIIASEQKAIIAQEIAINEEKKLAVAGAKAIKVTLVESINEFINAIGILGVVTQFFEILHQELLTFSNKYEKFKEDQAKIHFILIKKKAATLKWLSKMKAEINGENLSFLEWGKKWFRSNKEIANLLGLPSNNDR
ncbi:hypothetical protein RhiirA5_415199 [Rhizophagus irregularis]|uniref:Uncharacterized protein n=2 Tax=Rhizophagus irregularis TaxID=588596 RepID=A0A2N0PSM1_9GLOM|nr:hypothetical protein GLOIN_2v1782310 [Rhizophagus irregularis DAOM 181602=DAOM 197198]PKC09799.1 hypothetical protein RhiirA5_415199 [Rhizophagus irregularis]POG64957.1 hypothetical protein GLOIN_2v1782310 [Rhizophagus irregularis DAOM 181602=DAOM 197198]|eukprot:XP_025171823.1 hypothetical protein GLOIN_2v1782310 [Rhizophagus irregularis DAOM 181602=DAOM 197198]